MFATRDLAAVLTECETSENFRECLVKRQFADAAGCRFAGVIGVASGPRRSNYREGVGEHLKHASVKHVRNVRSSELRIS